MFSGCGCGHGYVGGVIQLVLIVDQYRVGVMVGVVMGVVMMEGVLPTPQVMD